MPSVIPASGTRPASTKGELVVVAGAESLVLPMSLKGQQAVVSVHY